MKKTFSIFLSIFTIVAISKSQEIIKVAAFNYYPAVFKDADGEIKGFYVDALNELGKKENLKFSFIYGTWDEGLERIKTGEVDALTSVAITEERLNYMDYTATPILTVWSEVYVNEKSEIDGILDLEGKTIAVMKSDYNGIYFKQYTEKLAINCEFIETTDFDEIFKLIEGGNVDAGIVNNIYGAPKSDEYGLISSGIIFNPFDIYFTVKKGSNQELLKILSTTLHNWKHDGNSVLNSARKKWSHGNVGAIEVFPKWLQKAIFTSLFIILVLIAFIALLRYRISAATKSIKESEERFLLAMKATNDGLFDWNLETNAVYYSPGWKKMLGYEDHELPNNFSIWENRTDSADVRKTWELIEKLKSKQIDRFVAEFKMQHKNGTWVDILSRAEAQFNRQGKAIRMIGTHVDITERKLNEEALIIAKEKAEEREQKIIEILEKFDQSQQTGKIGSWDWNMLTNEIWWSKTTYDIFEVNPKVFKPDFNNNAIFLHPDETDDYFQIFKNCIETGAQLDHDFKVITAQKKLKYCSNKGKIIYNENHVPVRFIGTLMDITERKQADEKLLASEDKFRTLFNTLTEGVALNEIVYNEQGEMVDYRIIEVNDAFYNFGDYTNKQVIGNVATKLYGMPVDLIKSFWENHKQQSETTFTEMRSPLENKFFYVATSPFKNNRFITSFFDITDLKLAEQALKESEEKLKSYFNSSPSSIFVWTYKDNDFVLTEINSTANKVTQNKASRFVGLKASEIYNDLTLIPEKINECFNNKCIIEFECNYKTRYAGDYEWVNFRFAYSAPDRVLLFTDSITKNKLAEQALKESEEKYRKLFENAQEGIFQTTPSGTYISVNPTLAKIYGYDSPDELINCRYDIANQTYVNSKDRERFLELINKQGFVKGFEYEVKDKDGNKLWFYEDAQAIKDLEGNIKYFEGFVINITERKQAEEALKLTRFSMDHASDGLFWMTPDARIIDCNIAACLSLGYTKEELLKLTIPDIDDDYQPEKWTQHFAELRQQHIQSFETKHRHKDGHYITVEIVANYVQYGGLELNCAFVRDITERKQAEEKLKAITNNAQDAIIMIDNMGLISFWNPAAEKILGHTHNEALGKNLHRLIAPKKYHELHEKSFSRFKKTGYGEAIDKTIEFEALTKNGNEIAVELSLSAININNEWHSVGILRDISERKLAEQALIESERQLKESQRVSRLGSYSWDLSTGLWTSSDILDEIFGIDENYGRSLQGWVDIIHADWKSVMSDYVTHEVLGKLQRFDKEYKITRIDNGRNIWVHGQGELVFDEKGNPIKLYGTIQDINERKLAEEKLRESEERFTLAMSASSDGLFDWNLETNDIYYSPGWKKMLGYDNHELPNNFSVWEKNTEPEDAKKSWNLQQKLIARQIDRFVLEFKMKHKKGHWVDILSRAEAIFNPDGKAIRIVGTHTDITERKKAEQALKESENKYRNLFDYSPVGTLIVGVDKRFIKCNAAFCNFLGYSENELIGKHITDVSYPDDAELGSKEIKEIIEGKTESYSLQKRYLRKDGQIVWGNVAINVVKDADNKPLFLLPIIQDITESKLAQEALKESEGKLSALFSSMTEMVALHEVVFNKNGEPINYRITDCNAAYNQITGIKKEDAIGKLATDVYGTEEPPYLNEFTRVAITGEPYAYTTYFAPMDKHFSISVVSPKKNQFATITTDITAMQQIQEVITTKNKELENYLYVSSHDLRSPLVNIQGFSQRLQKQLNTINSLLSECSLEPETKSNIDLISNKSIPETLNYIFTSVAKMDVLINSLLQISRVGRVKMEIKNVDITLLFNNIINMLNFQLNEISATISLGKLPNCFGDENTLNQLFSNILDNAIKYRNPEIPLIIKLEGKASFHKVIYSINDNGVGIAPKYLNKIWDVFYRVDPTVKESGEGIGLSIAKRIVDKHKGKIWAESEEGIGTTFYIELQTIKFEE